MLGRYLGLTTEVLFRNNIYGTSFSAYTEENPIQCHKMNPNFSFVQKLKLTLNF